MNSSVSVNFEDLLLTCIVPKCKKEFPLPATEQDFFYRNNLENPKRCPVCRSMKKAAGAAMRTPITEKVLGLSQREQKSVLQKVSEKLTEKEIRDNNPTDITGGIGEIQTRQIRELKDQVEKLWDAIDELIAGKRPISNLSSPGFKRY